MSNSQTSLRYSSKASVATISKTVSLILREPITAFERIQEHIETSSPEIEDTRQRIKSCQISLGEINDQLEYLKTDHNMFKEANKTAECLLNYVKDLSKNKKSTG
ncbi:hypothetical protein ACOME3_001675 [Neoechinorhynchus agilis]